MEQTFSVAKTNSPQLTRLQLRLVMVGYAAVLLLAAGLLFWRHLQYVMYGNDVDASGGMWAFGDLMLELFIAGLLLIPTLLLAFFIRTSETAFTRYSRTLLGISVTAPICVGAMLVPAIGQSGSGFLGSVGWFCLGRTSASPVFVAGFVLSWFLARFRRARRLIMYGVLIELGTCALVLASVVLPWHRG